MKISMLTGLLFLLNSFHSRAQSKEPDVLSEEFILRNKDSRSDRFSNLKQAVELAVAEAELTQKIRPFEIGIGIGLPLIFGGFLYQQSQIQGKFMMISGIGATGLTVLLNEIKWHRLKKAETLIDDDVD